MKTEQHVHSDNGVKYGKFRARGLYKRIVAGSAALAMLLSGAQVVPYNALDFGWAVTASAEEIDLFNTSSQTIGDSCGDNCQGHFFTTSSQSRAKTITITGGKHTINIRNVNILCDFYSENAPIAVTGNSDVTLNIEGENNFTHYADSRRSGIYVETGSSLTIEGNGILNVAGSSYGPYSCAAIGGGSSSPSHGNITINSGTINANGGNSSAGIGSSRSNTDCAADCGTITINGGTVTATGGTGQSGGYGGAGIGGGKASSGGKIIINGGTVKAIAGHDAAAIGGGAHDNPNIDCPSGGDVYIGGDANVTVEVPVGCGAGIGGGGDNDYEVKGGDGGKVTISDNAVVTVSSDKGAGIGGGCGGCKTTSKAGGAGADVTIQGNARVKVLANNGGSAGIGGGFGYGYGRSALSSSTTNGYGGAGGTVIIKDNAYVEVSGGKEDGAGIGGADGSKRSGNGGDVTISGNAVVIATGGTGKYGGAGIGGGDYMRNGEEAGTLTVNDNAWVVVNTPVSDSDGRNGAAAVSDGAGGVVFMNNDGTVYGDPIINADVEISEGKTLTIPSGSTLTLAEGASITNNGTITNNGAIMKNGTISGSGTVGGEGTMDTEVITQDMITVPDNLYYFAEGQDMSYTVGNKVKVYFGDKEFDIWKNGYKQSVTKNSDTSYTVTYTKDGKSVSKEVTVKKANCTFEVYTDKDTYSYGDYFYVNVKATGEGAELVKYADAKCGSFSQSIHLSGSAENVSTGSDWFKATYLDVDNKGGKADITVTVYGGDSSGAPVVYEDTITVTFDACTHTNKYGQGIEYCGDCGETLTAATCVVDGEITYYDNITAAWAYAQGKTATVTMLKNQTISELLEMKSGDITLKMSDGVKLSGGCCLIEVMGGKLTLNGCSLETTKTVATYPCIQLWGDSAVVDIVDCSMLNDSPSGTVIEVVYGTVNIHSGTFRAQNGKYTYGIYVSDEAKANLYGGTFISTDETISVSTYSDLTVGSLLANGYSYKKDGKWVTGEELNGKTLTGTVEVLPAAVKITEQPTSVRAEYNSTEPTKLTVKAEAGDPAKEITYQWYDADGKAIDGATESTYTVPVGLAVGEYSYYCAVTCDGCTVISDTATVTVSVGAQFKGVSASLDGDIALNYYIYLPQSVKEDSGAYVQFRVNGEITKIPVSSVTPESDGAYKFAYRMSAKEMHDYVVFTVCYGNGTSVELYDTNGNKLEGSFYGYRLSDYFDRLSFDPENKNPALAELAKATLAYGSYAQKAFGYDVDTAFSEIDLSDVTLESLEKHKMTKSGEIPEGLKLSGISLILESETAFCFYLKADDISRYSFALDNAAVTPVEVAGENLYCIRIANISSRELDTQHMLVINGTCTITFDALSYAYLTVKNGKNDAVTDAVKALCKYNAAADKYFESLGE